MPGTVTRWRLEFTAKHLTRAYCKDETRTVQGYDSEEKALAGLEALKELWAQEGYRVTSSTITPYYVVGR